MVVVEIIKIFESLLLFNVGIGVVYIFDGEYEFDVLIMYGGSKNVGVVVGVKIIRSLIEVVLLVMNEFLYVMFLGRGVEDYVKENGFE